MHLLLFLFFWSLLFWSIWRAFISPWLIGPRKVKVAFQVDTDSAETARKKISELQSALKYYVARTDHALDGISILSRQREQMAETFDRYTYLAHWIQDDRDAAEAEVERLKAENKELRKAWADAGTIASHRAGQNMKAQAEIRGLRDDIEKMTVQMAGISTAARGGVGCEVAAVKGQYGWSPAYQDVLELRIKYERLRNQPLSDRLRSTKL